MIAFPSDTCIWLVAGVTDMRKSFNGLGEQVQSVLNENPHSGHIFIFRGRRGDMVKVLWADNDGMNLYVKRLEEGCASGELILTRRLQPAQATEMRGSGVEVLSGVNAVSVPSETSGRKAHVG